MSNRTRISLSAIAVAVAVILATELLAPRLLVAMVVLLVVIAARSAPLVMRRLGEGSRRSLRSRR
jgi:hypothetical protein